MQVRQRRSLLVDIAGPGIIAQTDAQWQGYVRLYFRPGTPTQYNIEGFRSKEQWRYNAHCPVPVYLLFDALAVLSRRDSLFSDGNVAAAGSQPVGDVAYLVQIPFSLVYHNMSFGPSERSTIVYHRNAEVLVPQQLSLNALRMIVCRSQAEYETLLHLLPPGARRRWVDRIGVRPDLRLFFNRWTFIQQVEMSDEEVRFRFNQPTASPGPFDSLVEITETLTGRGYTAHNERFSVVPGSAHRITLGNLQYPQDYTARYFLDDQLAFASRYQQDDLPF